jgi:hypothetical protein
MKPEPIRAASPTRNAEKHADAAMGNPYLHFIMSEAWAALAASASYGLFHLGAFAAQHIADIFPLADRGPASFLEATLAWGAAISCAGTFVIITAYQMFFLIRHQWEKVQS